MSLKFISKITYFLLLYLLLSITTYSAESASNFFKWSTFSQFQKGTLERVTAIPTPGDGALVLSKSDNNYYLEGVYTTDAIPIQSGDHFVPSWNVETPEGTWVEIFVSAYIDSNNPNIKSSWTEFLSAGQWGQGIIRKSTNAQTLARCVDKPTVAQAAFDTDTLIIAGKEHFLSKVRIKVVFHTKDPHRTPILRLLAGSSRNTQRPIDKRKVALEFPNKNSSGKIDISLPAYSQFIRDKNELILPDGIPYNNNSIGSSICSPTTITGLLNYYGEDWLPEEIALNCRDQAYGFGNWSFSIAAGASFGYIGYYRYGNLDLLKNELQSGYPVGVGAKYSNKPDGKWPYIENAPLNTNGHIFLVRGLEVIDGVEYLLVNDSAAPSDKTATRKYKLKQFVKAWQPNCSMYILRPKEKNAGLYPVVQRVPAILRATTTIHPQYGREYELVVQGKRIILNSDFTIGKNASPQTGKSGVIAYTIKRSEDQTQYPKTACRQFFYTITSESGNVYLNSISLKKKYKGKITIEVYIVTNTGTTYLAELN